MDVHLVLGSPGAGNRMADETFARLGLRRTIAVTVPSFAAVASVVSSTDFLGGMPREAAVFYGRALPLQVLTGIAPALRFDMYLHWHERTHRDAAQLAFRSAISGARPARARSKPRDS